MPKRSNKASDSSQSGANPKSGLWLTVSYEPVSLFSLKRSDATSMAARTNLVPTPYAIKMALLKVLLEMQGGDRQADFAAWIETEFSWIRDLEIRIQPPERLVVNRNGYKLRYYDQTADKADKSRPTMPLQDGFVFREWVHLQGELKICCGATARISELKNLFSQINYFGKRGCFFQYLPNAVQETEQPTITTALNSSFTVQPMDDLGNKATFGRINPYSEEKIRPGSDRVIQPGFLPLQLTATSARYDLYTRTCEP
jgi:hypothetical protein